MTVSGLKPTNPRIRRRWLFFKTTGTKFELYSLDLPAQDIHLVHPALPGGRIVKEPTNAFWGGYHAYFADPDGYYWKVAWGPNFRFDAQDMLVF